MTILAFDVVGVPAPMGSKRHVGRGILVESSRRVKPWRQDVKAAALQCRTDNAHDTFTGPVAVVVAFTLTRPKHHYRSGRFAGALRDNAPEFVSSKPDIDKLLRSTLDALGEAGVYRDDAQVARLTSTKVYGGAGDHVGASVSVRSLDDDAHAHHEPMQHPRERDLGK